MLTEEQAAAYGFSLAVASNGLLFCSGQIGSNADGSVPEDPQQQFELAFNALGKVLASHGLDASDIVDLTTFHVDYPAHMEEFFQAKGAFLGSARPAWTAIGVPALGHPQSLVELKAVARLKS